jgi:hypothetical protein
VDPFKKKPVDPKQAELLARAAGKPLPQTPKSAKPLPAGVTGNPPLPTGRVVGQTAPSSLTAVERETLLAAGWTEDVPLPASQDGLKQLQQAVTEIASAEVPFPVDPRREPLKVTTVPIESLPPAEQKRFTNALAGKIQDINAQEAEARAAAAKQQQLAAKEMQVKGIAASVGVVDKAVDNFRNRVAQAANAPVDDVPEVVAANPAAVEAMRVQDHFATRAEQQRPAPPPPPPAPPPPTSETGADGVMLSHCPHCSWDLAVPDGEEPPYQDKIGFLHALLGDRTYVKQYPLFSGNVLVTFRTLTIKELDQVYKQAFEDRQAGKITTEVDYYERLNRYRLMLQLQEFRVEGPDGFVKDLPDGYSASTNPHSTGHWVKADQEANFAPNETGLPAIEAWMIDEVLKTEAVFRVVNNTCNRFNRLTSKLEAMADNSDFWKPTGEQS